VTKNGSKRVGFSERKRAYRGPMSLRRPGDVSEFEPEGVS